MKKSIFPKVFIFLTMLISISLSGCASTHVPGVPNGSACSILRDSIIKLRTMPIEINAVKGKTAIALTLHEENIKITMARKVDDCISEKEKLLDEVAATQAGVNSNNDIAATEIAIIEENIANEINVTINKSRDEYLKLVLNVLRETRNRIEYRQHEKCFNEVKSMKETIDSYVADAVNSGKKSILYPIKIFDSPVYSLYKKCLSH